MRSALLAAGVLVLAASAAWADPFIYPPEDHWPYGGDPWYNPWVIPSPYQRNITWDFDNAQAPLVPVYAGYDDDLLKDQDEIRLGGTDVHTFETDPTGTTTRVGFLGIDNRLGSVMAEGNVTLHIENWNSPNVTKHLWMEMEFLASDDAGGEFSVQLPQGFNIVAAEQGFIGPLDDNGYLTVIALKIGPNPPWEELTLSMTVPPGEYILVDYVHFATECVPEPATLTLALLGTGTLAVLRRRRRRREA